MPGAPSPSSRPAKACVHCGLSLPADAAFCSYCGYRQDGDRGAPLTSREWRLKDYRWKVVYLGVITLLLALMAGGAALGGTTTYALTSGAFALVGLVVWVVVLVRYLRLRNE